MKLIRFITNTPSVPSFGTVIAGHAVAFDVLQARAGTSHEYLRDSRTYLAHLPGSEKAARSLHAWGEQHYHELGANELFALDTVQLKEPIEVAALFDFGLTQRHLKNSLETLLK